MALWKRKRTKQRQRTDKTIKNWLDRLQQESWQLELLVSGFAIFLLIGGLEPFEQLLRDLGEMVDRNNQSVLVFLLVVIFFSYLLTLINLLVHVVLRGLWIGAIGLRYVSGDIQYYRFRFRPPFRREIPRLIGSFDRYIEQLEQICSVVFAFTFLLILMLLSLASYVFIGTLLVSAMAGLENLLGWNIGPVVGIVAIVFLVLTLLYLFDFLSFGRIKRSRWLARWYYPVYRLLGWMTLAFLYRAIYYNFIDNALGRRALWLTIPYIIIALSLFSSHMEGFPFLPKGYLTQQGHPLSGVLISRNYDALRSEKVWVEWLSIPDVTITESYLPVFLRYNAQLNTALRQICPTLSEKSREGFHFAGAFWAGFNEGAHGHQDPDREHLRAVQTCLTDAFRLYLNDSLLVVPPAVLYLHPNQGERGLLTQLDIATLRPGLHELRLDRRAYSARGDSLYFKTCAYAPFWKR